MPLFGNVFSPKKTPPRKSASLSSLHTLDRVSREIELGLDHGAPVMNIGGQSLKFDNGQWVSESVGDSGVHKEVQRLRKRNQQLEEENNLLRLKIDILLDMHYLQLLKQSMFEWNKNWTISRLGMKHGK
ncbi:protein chibby homolog 1 isoform X1 [Stegostoma tigrinum]|uniref:protein chibby homolog 1 isoform X1 n=1 Tax=Stegostoma tigrinum TaxID=3053191 RepID=UPI00202B68E3|nr:protein chibby homolog 1 isoform X1 [Stegostoma tigrinum]